MRIWSVGNNAGITLIELLVVVAIIGVLAGISYPSVAAGIDSVRMRSATDSVASILNGAVDRAERRRHLHQMLGFINHYSLHL